jgi:hypothetical protein
MKTLWIASLIGVVGTVAAGWSGASTRPSIATGGVPMANFTSNCRFSHSSNDDPIMHPGMPGMSHNHSFFGNVSTNAFSTLASLRRAGTSCHRRGDRAAYWAPTLVNPHGKLVRPLSASVYYIRATIKPVHAFPAGLRMIAGNMYATKPQLYIAWSCGPVSGRAPSRSVPTCPSRADTGLQLTVTFPDCWNGRDLNSADHKSHMTYAVRGLCPSSHPVTVPSMSLTIRYAVTGGRGYHLASGGPYSGHADFVNAWNERELVRLVRECLNAGRQCGSHH